MFPYQYPLPLLDMELVHVLVLLQQMSYDDALIGRGWRIEYLYLSKGYPHYRIYKGGKRKTLFAVIEIRAFTQLERIQTHLAFFAVALGMGIDTQLLPYGNSTHYETETPPGRLTFPTAFDPQIGVVKEFAHTVKYTLIHHKDALRQTVLAQRKPKPQSAPKPTPVAQSYPLSLLFEEQHENN